MAERRSTRTRRRRDDEELTPDADEELAPDADEELAPDADEELAPDADEEPDDELAREEEPDDELAMDADEDELAEEEATQADADDDRGTRRSRRADNDGLTAAQAGQAALRQIAGLTGKPTEGVTGVEPGEDGWVVGVEVVEDRRIPSSTDVLATYETEIDRDGSLLSYRRVRRYARGRGDDGDA